MLDDLDRPAERISREDHQKGAPPQEPLNSLEPLSNPDPTRLLLSRIERRESLGSGSMMPHETLESHRDTIPSARSPRRQRKGHPSATGPSLNEDFFPWKGTSAVLRAGLEPEGQQCLELLEDSAIDPAYVVRKILLSPGCPDFPPDQWLNIVKGFAVDLAKVLGAHYSTDVEAKQSQDLGTSSRSLFESPSSPKASGRMETGSFPLGRPSKRSHSPCPAGTPSMRPTKHTCRASLPPSLPHSILGHRTRPSHPTLGCQSKAPSLL